MKNLTLSLVAGLSLCFGFQAAWADDFLPPPWRNTPHSVFAEWDFNLAPPPPNQPLVPDNFSFTTGPVFGGPYLLAQQVPPQLVFNGQDQFIIDLPNFIDPLPLKLIRLQLAYMSNNNDPFPGGPQITGFDSQAQVVDVQLVNTTVLTPGGGNPNDGLILDYELRPNPDWERFVIPVSRGTDLKQIVIDTTSIPEPTSLALIGSVATFGLFRRRRSV